MGPGRASPFPELMVDLLRNRGGCVLDVNDDKEEMMPGLLDVRCDQGESLMARLASLTVLWSGFINCLTSGLSNPIFRPCAVLVVARSPQAYSYLAKDLKTL